MNKSCHLMHTFLIQFKQYTKFYFKCCWAGLIYVVHFHGSIYPSSMVFAKKGGHNGRFCIIDRNGQTFQLTDIWLISRLYPEYRKREVGQPIHPHINKKIYGYSCDVWIPYEIQILINDADILKSQVQVNVQIILKIVNTYVTVHKL